MSAILDRERLLEGLHRAADEVLPRAGSEPASGWCELLGMRRAWRVVAAAIEDGEFDGPALPVLTGCICGERGECVYCQWRAAR